MPKDLDKKLNRPKKNYKYKRKDYVARGIVGKHHVASRRTKITVEEELLHILDDLQKHYGISDARIGIHLGFSPVRMARWRRQAWQNLRDLRLVLDAIGFDITVTRNGKGGPHPDLRLTYRQLKMKRNHLKWDRTKMWDVLEGRTDNFLMKDEDDGVLDEPDGWGGDLPDNDDDLNNLPPWWWDDDGGIK